MKYHNKIMSLYIVSNSAYVHVILFLLNMSGKMYLIIVHYLI